MDKIFHVKWELAVLASNDAEARELALAIIEDQPEDSILISTKEITKDDLLSNPKIPIINY